MLEVGTTIENHSTETMPVSIGFHPYFHISDAPRDSWKVGCPRESRSLLSPAAHATGETKPMPYQAGVAQRRIALDDVFTGLIRGESGRRGFRRNRNKAAISVLYGEDIPSRSCTLLRDAISSASNR